MTSHVDVAVPASEAEPRTGLLTLSLVVAAVAVMASSLDGPFLYDDVPLIHGNDRVHGFSQWREWFQGTLWDTNYDPSEMRYARGFWRPLVLFSYAVDWRVGGGSPFSFHITNLLIHTLNATLVFRVLRCWLDNRIAALLAALLFAVHPVQTESVAWIAGRTDSLCLLGMLVGVLGLRRFREHRVAGGAILALGLVVAFGSKEAAVTFPVLAALEAWSTRRPSLVWAEVQRMLRSAAPFVFLSVAFLAVHRMFVPGWSSSHALTLGNRVLLPLEALGRYAGLVIFPDDLALGRATIAIAEGVHAPERAFVGLGIAVAASICIGAWRARRANPTLALALLSFGALLLPVITVGWRNDVNASPRFLYVPMLALAFAAGALLQTTRGTKPFVRIGFVVVTAVLGARAFVRAADYSDEERFWSREIASNERYSAAQQYFITRALREHRPGAALKLAHRWFADPFGSALGKSLLMVNTVAAALDLTPDLDAESITKLQAFALALGASQPAELSLPRFGLDVRLPASSRLLGLTRIQRRQYLLFAANAASRLGDDEAAVLNVDAALDGCSECWTILRTSALIIARAGQFERAQALLERAERVGPYSHSGEDIFASLHDAIRWRTAGPRDPVLRDVGFYSALGAFGRAYRIARPVMEKATLNPESIPSLAELASLAGDMKMAETLLRRVFSEAEAGARLEELYARVPWRDRPSPEAAGGPG